VFVAAFVIIIFFVLPAAGIWFGADSRDRAPQW
jgi:hypothetical protein